MKKTIIMSTFVVMGLAISGCGGGGEGGALFNSDAKPAPANVDTGKEVVKDIVGNQAQSKISPLSTEADTVNKPLLLIDNIRNALDSIPEKKVRSNNVNQAFECPYGGSGNIKGNGSDTRANMTVTYNNCDMGGITFDGKMHVDATANYDTLESMKISFPSDFTMLNSVQSITIYKNSSLNMDNYNDDEESFDFTQNIKSKINDELYGLENSKWHVDSSGYAVKMYQLSGKEYIKNLESYVTYDETYDMSKTPFVFGSYGISSGAARYITENNGKIMISAEQGDVKVLIDADSDGTYEKEETLEEF